MTWECGDCGETTDEPPCDACGSESGNWDRFVWVCTGCGKQQSRHNPPCSRCGTMQFEKRPPDYLALDNDELAGPSYLELAKPALPILGILALVGVLVFGGVVSVPSPLMNAMSGQGPHVSTVPGQADTANGMDLESAESKVHERVNDRREADGLEPLSIRSGLDDLATFENRNRVVDNYDGGTVHGSSEDISIGCQRRVTLLISSSSNTGTLTPDIDDFESEDELARALVEKVARESGAWMAVEEARYGYGVDVHVAPDGTIWAIHAVR